LIAHPSSDPTLKSYGLHGD